MKYTIRLQDKKTGVQKDFIAHRNYLHTTQDERDQSVMWYWLDGNNSCDCNRSLRLWEWDGGEELECNIGPNHIDLLKISDNAGRVVWQPSG